PLAMATLAGESSSTEGIIFGGSREVRAPSLPERDAQIGERVKEEAALAEDRVSLCAKCDEAKTALETASRLQRALNEAERKVDNLRSEQTALERQVGVADERIAQSERELQTMRHQLANEQNQLTAVEPTQKETTT